MGRQANGLPEGVECVVVFGGVDVAAATPPLLSTSRGLCLWNRMVQQ